MCVNEQAATRPSCYKHSGPYTVKPQIRYKPEASGSGAEMRLSRPEDSRGLMSEGSRLDFEKESL